MGTGQQAEYLMKTERQQEYMVKADWQQAECLTETEAASGNI